MSERVHWLMSCVQTTLAYRTYAWCDLINAINQSRVKYTQMLIMPDVR